MKDGRSNWFFRIARGHSNGARYAGSGLLILSILLLPGLYISSLNRFRESGGIVAHGLSALACVVWISFANDIRKFTKGERLVNIITSAEGSVRTVGVLTKDVFARWSIAAFDLLVLLGIARIACSG